MERAELTEAQRWSIVLARHVSGLLSAVASSIIVYHVIMRYIAARKRLRSSNELVTTYHRLMLGLSVVDVLYSFWVGMSSWAVPASSGVIYGYGNTATCSAQGFFSQFGVAAYLYSAALSTYFLLKIRYNVSDDKQWEIWFHLVPWGVALVTGSTGLALTLFNPMPLPEMGCWLGVAPVSCMYPGGPDCTRGYLMADYATLFAFFMSFAWFFASVVIILVNNVLINHAIRRQERRNAQYLSSRLQRDSVASTASGLRRFSLPFRNENKPVAAPVRGNNDTHSNVADLDGSATSLSTHAASASQMPDSSDPTESTVEATDGSPAAQNDGLASRPRPRPSQAQARFKASRAAATQSVLYVSAACFTAFWVVMPYVAFWFALPNVWVFFFAFMVSAFGSLHGFFNLVVFRRLEYLRLRSSKPTWSRVRCATTCLVVVDSK